MALVPYNVGGLVPYAPQDLASLGFGMQPAIRGTTGSRLGSRILPASLSSDIAAPAQLSAQTFQLPATYTPTYAGDVLTVPSDDGLRLTGSDVGLEEAPKPLQIFRLSDLAFEERRVAYRLAKKLANLMVKYGDVDQAVKSLRDYLINRGYFIPEGTDVFEKATDPIVNEALEQAVKIIEVEQVTTDIDALKNSYANYIARNSVQGQGPVDNDNLRRALQARMRSNLIASEDFWTVVPGVVATFLARYYRSRSATAQATAAEDRLISSEIRQLLLATSPDVFGSYTPEQQDAVVRALVFGDRLKRIQRLTDREIESRIIAEFDMGTWYNIKRLNEPDIYGEYGMGRQGHHHHKSRHNVVGVMRVHEKRYI